MKLFVVVVLITLLNASLALPNGIGSRIIGGNPAMAGQFPFAAAITVTTSTGRYFCGGTLISAQWIVTAGQCVDQALSFTIQLGANSLSNQDSNRETFATSGWVLHPEYNPDNLSHDIGLIELRLKITFTNYILPIHSLPSSDVVSSSRVVVIGWGQTSDADGALSDSLQYTAVTTLSNEECRLTYGNQITDEMVCIEGNYNEGSCHGDTGGPLVNVIALGNAQLIGVSSFISGQGCETTDPSGYTRVFPYLEWVRNVTDIAF